MLIPVAVGINVEKEMEVYLKIAFFRFRIIPKKRKKINLKKYTPEALAKAEEKRKKKEEKKRLKKEKKNKKKKKSANKNASKLSSTLKSPTQLPALISDVIDIVSILSVKFFRKLKVNILNFKIRVGSDNAAKTALLYSGICTAVNSILALLCQFTKYDERDIENLEVHPDFLYEKTDVNIHILFTLRPGQAFTFLFSALPEIFRILDYL